MDFYGHLWCVLIVFLISLQTICLSEQCYCLKKQIDGITNPVFFEQNPQNGQFYVAQQSGVIHIYSEDWKQESRPLLNLTNDVYISENPYDERGLLSLALHPQFPSNNLIYTYSIRMINGKEYAVISKIKNSEKLVKEDILLAIEQPHHKRNGGQVSHVCFILLAIEQPHHKRKMACFILLTIEQPHHKRNYGLFYSVNY